MSLLTNIVVVTALVAASGCASQAGGGRPGFPLESAPRLGGGLREEPINRSAPIEIVARKIERGERRFATVSRNRSITRSIGPDCPRCR